MKMDDPSMEGVFQEGGDQFLGIFPGIKREGG